jgi:hypothetical protein
MDADFFTAALSPWIRLAFSSRHSKMCVKRVGRSSSCHTS